MKLRVVPLLLLAACQPPGQAPQDSTEVQHLMTQAASVERGGDSAQADKLYAQAVSLSKYGVDAHVKLAARRQAGGDLDGANALLEEAQVRQPDNPSVALALGKLQIARDEPEAALRSYGRGITVDPDNAQLQNGMGIALDMLGRSEEAQAAYRESLAKAKGPTEATENNLGLSLVMSGRYDEAIARLAMIPGASEKPTVRQNLALAYGLKGDMEKARQWGAPDLSESEMGENLAFYRAYREKLEGR